MKELGGLSTLNREDPVFLTDPDAVIKLWGELRTDKKLMCSIQDDNAVRPNGVR